MNNHTQSAPYATLYPTLMRRKYPVVAGRIGFRMTVGHLGGLQSNPDARASFRIALRGNYTAVFFHNLFHNSQTKPAAPGFC